MQPFALRLTPIFTAPGQAPQRDSVGLACLGQTRRGRALLQSTSTHAPTIIAGAFSIFAFSVASSLLPDDTETEGFRKPTHFPDLSCLILAARSRKRTMTAA